MPYKYPKTHRRFQPIRAYPRTQREWPPLFCLLDSDNLVTKLSIESFKLLTKVPDEFAGVQNYVELDLDVVIHPITPMMGTIDMLFKG